MKVIRDEETGTVIELTFLRPSNFHAHFRLDNIMQAIAYELMWAFKYVLVMPNDGLVDTFERVRDRHLELTSLARKFGLQTEFVMTVYLTRRLTPAAIKNITTLLPFRVEVKYYPPEQGATTGSGFGVPLDEADETLRAMAELGVPLLGHFESVHDRHGTELPHDQRETYFMCEEFPRLRDAHPSLRICIEHASTADAVVRVKADTSGKTVATFTPHHMLLTIEQIKRLSWANHVKCMPIPKGPEDVAACLEFATSGDYRAIAGDDTAAHLSETKKGSFEEAKSGAFWTAHSIAAYAVAFEKVGALDWRFEYFMSKNGAEWRGLPLPAEDDTITLRRDTKTDIPEPIAVPDMDDVIVPLGWSLQEDDRLKLGLSAVR